MGKGKKKAPKSLHSGLRIKREGKEPGQDAPPLAVPNDPQAAAPSVKQLLLQAQSLHRQGRLDEAERLYAIIRPDQLEYAEALHAMGIIDSMRARPESAIEKIQSAIELEPKNVQFHDNLGVVFKHNNKPEIAVQHHQAAVDLDPTYVSAQLNLAISLQALGRHQDCAQAYMGALKMEPGNVMARLNLGKALWASGELKESINVFRSVLELDPNNAEAHDNLAIVQSVLGHFEEATEHHRQAAELQPQTASYFNNWAYSERLKGDVDKAEELYTRALKLNPDLAEAIFCLGMLRSNANKLEDGLALLEKARMLMADDPIVLAHLAKTLEHLCMWDRLDEVQPKLFQAIVDELGEIDEESTEGPKSDKMMPFHSLTLPFSNEQLKRLAQNEAMGIARTVEGESYLHMPSERDRLRIGYVSPDFSSHAVGFIINNMFTLHDRERFEIIGYSLQDSDDDYRQRIEAGCDEFVDLVPLSIRDSAERIKNDEIDILVDLAGYTTKSRPQVFAMRPCPIQTSFLGFPCSTGADYIDYRITDKGSVPDEVRNHFVENIVYLPDTPIAWEPLELPELDKTRADYLLPEHETVFCYFNASYRINREIFAAWMEILKRTPGSVMWLKGSNKTAILNLVEAAEAQGVDRGRLVFDDFGPMSQRWHHRLADLWLDAPLSSGTAGILCHWAGLPVLTLKGKVPQNLTGTAIVKAARMDEMVMDNLEDYIERAVELGNSADKILALKEKLLTTRDNLPLFDQPRLVKNLEKAYLGMWKRYLDGGLVEDFQVERD